MHVLLSSYVYLLYLMCVCCTLYVCVVPYVYLLYNVCIAVLTLAPGLLARSQYPEGPVTGQLDTGFSWFPCVYKQMLMWFPSFEVATTCLSCSPPYLDFLVTFLYLCTCKITMPRVITQLHLIIIIIIIIISRPLVSVAATKQVSYSPK